MKEMQLRVLTEQSETVFFITKYWGSSSYHAYLICSLILQNGMVILMIYIIDSIYI